MEDKQFTPLEEYSFCKTVFERKLENYITSITEYQERLREVVTEDINVPIFLDTNALTKYYKSSLKSREKLKSFIEKKAKNIFITGQVQREFIKNREEIIAKFRSDLKQFSKNFESDVVRKITSYHEGIKKHLDDFVGVEELLSALTTKANELKDVIDKRVDSIGQDVRDLERNDSYLQVFLKTNLLDELPEADIEILKKQFDLLKGELEADTADKTTYEQIEIFPGVKDIPKKKNNPYGDYIVYHEILKHMKEYKTDVVFITFDSKGDWLNLQGTAHNHYVRAMKFGTGQFMFILDGDRYFDDVLKIDLVELVDDQQNFSNPITPNAADTQYSRIQILGSQRIALLDRIRALYKLITSDDRRGPVDILLSVLVNKGIIAHDFRGETLLIVDKVYRLERQIKPETEYLTEREFMELFLPLKNRTKMFSELLRNYEGLLFEAHEAQINLPEIDDQQF